MKASFRAQLAQLINSESMENGSDTPDFILAEYLQDCLDLFDRTVRAREKWYGRARVPIPSYEAPKPPPLQIRQHDGAVKFEAGVLPAMIACSQCGRQYPVGSGGGAFDIGGSFVCNDCSGLPSGKQPCKSC